MNTFPSLVVIASAYLMGSIPIGLLLVRVTTREDVRKIGSGRTGGTNVLRAAGPWVAALAVLGDGIKGLLAVLLARTTVGSTTLGALAGVAAVLGHNYSIFIGFKGGAGTACTVGGAIGLWPWNGPILAGILAIAIIATHHASVGSIVVAVLTPIIFALRASLTDAPWTYLIHGLGTATLTLWALRPNIRRLQQGDERRVVLRPKACISHK